MSPKGDLETLRHEEALVDVIEETRRRLLNRGRAAVGVHGEERAEAVRAVLKRNNLSLYTLIALGIFAFVDSFQGLIIGVLGPEISRSLGLSKGGLASIVLVRSLALSLATLAIAHIVGRRAIRGLVAIVTAFGWSLTTLLTAFVRSGASLAGLTLLDGASSGSVAAIHNPLLMDTYPPQVRVRTNSYYMLFLQGTSIVAPLLVAFLVGVFDFTWRGVFLVLGIVSTIAAVFGLGLRDPGFGRFDTQLIRRAVREAAGESGDPVTEDPPIGLFEGMRRLLLMPTMRKILVASIIAGMAGVPFQTYFAFFLAERWGMSASERALFGAFVSILSFLVIPFVAARGDRLFSADPARLLRLVSWIQFTALGFTALAVLSPVFAFMVAGVAVAGALPTAITPAMSTTVMAIIPARMRSHMIALLGIATFGAGGTAGIVLLGGIERRLGQSLGLLSMLIPLAIGVALLRSAARTINHDLNRTVESVIEQEELAVLRQRGERLPLLACRKVSFSYGHVQVLFDVNFTVDEGEMVALLGTNGAGKSTLLNVISGILLPSSGSVRYDGGDITYIDAERRVPMGISQVPGGRAVFGPLTVVENLRLFGYTHGRDRRAVERAIESAFDAFPRLAERRDQLASTLSGGEQQMLGLSQAFILQPRLLCIDELSLGLAPKIVAQLLDMVRRINARGTAVVLVEQSATIALSLVAHAYFMERGEIRFDGRAEDLLGRSDLLRSVFLKGAASVAETRR